MIGGLISRSSLKCFKCPQLFFIVCIQGLNCLIWMIEAFTISIQVYPILIVGMFIVGIVGGLCYVNTFHGLMIDKDILLHEKELAVNILCFFDDFGVIIATIVSVILDNTLLRID